MNEIVVNKYKAEPEEEPEADSKTGTCVVCGAEDTSIRRRFGWCIACEKRYSDYIRTDNTRQETNNNMLPHETLTHETLTAFNLSADRVSLAIPRLIERLNNHEKVKNCSELKFDLGYGIYTKHLKGERGHHWGLCFEDELLFYLDNENNSRRTKIRGYLILSDILKKLDSENYEEQHINSDIEDFEVRR